MSASAIRFYEEAGLLVPRGRRGGARVYEASAVDRLALIALAKGAGFTLAEIRKLLAGFARRTPPGARWRSLAEAQLPELDRRIAEAQRMKDVLERMTACECPTLEECSRAIRAAGEGLDFECT
jgi:MerR family redox-sensitive transcriptional activator SoxR